MKNKDELMVKLNDDEEVIPDLVDIICTHNRAIKCDIEHNFKVFHLNLNINHLIFF